MEFSNSDFGAERIVASLLASLLLGRITPDKRENFILAKLPLETSFIRKPLYEMLIMVINNSW
jgi:hypothetical protein